MDLKILNQNFGIVYILDTYISLVWVDKYAEVGTFEFTVPITTENLENLKADYYVQSDFSDHLMIIEDISIESNVTDGNRMKVVGRSLESILERRIVWQQTNLDGSLQDGVSKLIYANLIGGDGSTNKPAIVGGDDRKIANFVFQASEDATITALTMEHQYTGDNLLDIITALCDTNNIGFRVLLNGSNQFVFELYAGTNRSYNQQTNPYVIFSPDFDNLLSSNYVEKSSVLRNVALVGGEGEGTSRTTVTVGSKSDLERREIFVDASGIRKENLATAKYESKLTSYGNDYLTENNKDQKSFDGQCETTQIFKYGVDFFLGDIVQMENEYGIQSASRVTEFTWSISTSGVETYPTFVSVDNET